MPQKIGSYTILSKLGEGGMAVVYLAERGALKKKVALKVLREDFNSNRHVRGRFLNEARQMSHLQHPNIVGVYDLVDEPEFVAMEMEYVEGVTLKEHLKQNGALPDDEIEKLLPQMKAALDYIHEKGFVHRDVKPSNFMLTPGGTIKLTDFGIAKNIEDAGQDYTGTATGMQMGTPKYMSPEQVRSTKSVTYKSDIYSLGVVLWEMVTGKVPYDIKTESTFDVFRKIVDEPLENTGTKWDVLIQQATRKEAGEREFDINSVVQKTEKKETKKERHEKNEEKPEKRRSWWTSPLAFIIYAGFAISLIFSYGINLSEKSSSTEKVISQKSVDSYNSVIIGNQVWMTENLNVDKFRNGDPIPHAKSSEEWKKAGENRQPAWCYYDNDPENGKKYGKLYNWYAVNDSRGLAPKGWKVPTEKDWKKLIEYLDGERNAGDKLKSMNGWTDRGNGTNKSGFSALPGGSRYSNGEFGFLNKFGVWWQAPSRENEQRKVILLSYINKEVDLGIDDEENSGLSVRCVQNDNPNENRDDKRNKSTDKDIANPKKQTSYKFKYEKFTVHYQGNSKTQNVPGEILLLADEVQLLSGNKGEKFFIREIDNESNKLIINTVNSEGEKAIFTIFTRNGETKVETVIDGVTGKFDITEGVFSKVKLYQDSKFKRRQTGNKEKISIETKSNKDCECEKIYRDDGTKLIQCAPYPVGSNNNTEIGVSMVSNGEETFVKLTVRFRATAKNVNGDLTIRLENNNLTTLKLVNEQLANIGNSQVAQAVFLTQDEDIQKLKNSNLETISFKLKDGLIHTYQANSNKDILKIQAGCLQKL